MLDHLFERKDRYDAIVMITPLIASAWLAKYNKRNRSLRQDHIRRLAEEMLAGRWRVTHQGIAFSSEPVLLDGQHRLAAVARAGIPVQMRVFFNEPADGMDVIDANMVARTNLDVINLAGYVGQVSAKELATLRRMLAGLGCEERYTAKQEADLFMRHRDAIRFAHDNLTTCEVKNVCTSVTRAVIARAFYTEDHTKLAHFAEVLKSGLPTCEEDQPIILLFRYLVTDARSGHSDPVRRERYAKTERALDAYLRGERLKALRATSAELFPIPDDEAIHDKSKL